MYFGVLVAEYQTDKDFKNGRVVLKPTSTMHEVTWELETPTVPYYANGHRVFSRSVVTPNERIWEMAKQVLDVSEIKGVQPDDLTIVREFLAQEYVIDTFSNKFVDTIKPDQGILEYKSVCSKNDMPNFVSEIVIVNDLEIIRLAEEQFNFSQFKLGTTPDTFMYKNVTGLYAAHIGVIARGMSLGANITTINNAIQAMKKISINTAKVEAINHQTYTFPDKCPEWGNKFDNYTGTKWHRCLYDFLIFPGAYDGTTRHFIITDETLCSLAAALLANIDDNYQAVNAFFEDPDNVPNNVYSTLIANQKIYRKHINNLVQGRIETLAQDFKNPPGYDEEHDKTHFPGASMCSMSSAEFIARNKEAYDIYETDGDKDTRYANLNRLINTRRGVFLASRFYGNGLPVATKCPRWAKGIQHWQKYLYDVANFPGAYENSAPGVAVFVSHWTEEMFDVSENMEDGTRIERYKRLVKLIIDDMVSKPLADMVSKPLADDQTVAQYELDTFPGAYQGILKDVILEIPALCEIVVRHHTSYKEGRAVDADILRRDCTIFRIEQMTYLLDHTNIINDTLKTAYPGTPNKRLQKNWAFPVTTLNKNKRILAVANDDVQYARFIENTQPGTDNDKRIANLEELVKFLKSQI